MQLLVLKEEEAFETRVAVVPDTVKKYRRLNIDVYVQSQAGLQSGFADEDYEQHGAVIVGKINKILPDVDCVLCINTPDKSITKHLAENCSLIALNPQIENNESLNLFALEKMPRITRAQSMDVLSSQANLAGYKAVIEAVATYTKAIPMMMTAAGMVQPAKVLILGAGVAGLQAIATAKRLGAIVYAFDVRKAAKEQVESLSGEFIEVADEQDAEDSSGYAREMSDEYKQKQAALVDKYARLSDIVISTALIPGRPAPMLIPEATVKGMKQGSVIVDLATSTGGNCELSEANEVVTRDGVTIIGYENLSRNVATTASTLLANNYFNFVDLLFDSEQQNIIINHDDEIIQNTLNQA